MTEKSTRTFSSSSIPPKGKSVGRITGIATPEELELERWIREEAIPGMKAFAERTERRLFRPIRAESAEGSPSASRPRASGASEDDDALE